MHTARTKPIYHFRSRPGQGFLKIFTKKDIFDQNHKKWSKKAKNHPHSAAENNRQWPKKVSSFLPILLYYSSCTVCLFCFVKIKFWNFLLIKFFKLIKMLVYNKTIFQTMTALNLNCMKENFLDHKSHNSYTVIQYI